MEYIHGDPLFDVIQQKNGFTEPESKVISKQIIAALYYLHQRGIAHRDIKLENIMVKGSGRRKSS